MDTNIIYRRLHQAERAPYEEWRAPGFMCTEPVLFQTDANGEGLNLVISTAAPPPPPLTGASQEHVACGSRQTETGVALTV